MTQPSLTEKPQKTLNTCSWPRTCSLRSTEGRMNLFTRYQCFTRDNDTLFSGFEVHAARRDTGHPNHFRAPDSTCLISFIV